MCMYVIMYYPTYGQCSVYVLCELQERLFIGNWEQSYIWIHGYCIYVAYVYICECIDAFVNAYTCIVFM